MHRSAFLVGIFSHSILSIPHKVGHPVFIALKPSFSKKLFVFSSRTLCTNSDDRTFLYKNLV